VRTKQRATSLNFYLISKSRTGRGGGVRTGTKRTQWFHAPSYAVHRGEREEGSKKGKETRRGTNIR